jgi:hypothetical protein
VAAKRVFTAELTAPETAPPHIHGRHILTVPDLGAITALTFHRTIDDPSRFKSTMRVSG